MAKLLFLAGSARKDSINKKLAQTAADMAEKAGADVTFIDLKDYPLPLYDGDLEDTDGMPENAQKLKALFVESDGFFIASPEYNSGITPLLKNLIDWMSRPHTENEAPLIAYKGKVAALGAATPGGLGGIRALPNLRFILCNIGVHVIPDQIAVSNGFKAFDENGALSDERQAGFLQNTIETFVNTAETLGNAAKKQAA